jgi:hypothetical protein
LNRPHFIEQSLPEKVEDAVKVGLNVTQKLVKIGGDALENPEELLKEKKVERGPFK